MRINETFKSEGPMAPPIISLHPSTDQVRIDKPVELSATDPESGYLDNYLRALNIPVTQRLKLCNEVIENFHQQRMMCERLLSPAWVINEACKRLAHHNRVPDGQWGSQESMLATVESRLHIWLSAGSARQESTPEVRSLGLQSIVSTPPIRRAHMPAVVLELNPLRRLTTRLKGMVLWVRSVTLQAYRRLLVEM
jgi:hypothetical protein